MSTRLQHRWQDYGGFGDDGDGGFEGNNDSGFGDELGGFGGFEEVTPAEKVAAAIAEAKEISSSLPTSLPKPNSDEEFELDGFGTDEDDVYDNNDCETQPSVCFAWLCLSFVRVSPQLTDCAVSAVHRFRSPSLSWGARAVGRDAPPTP